MRLSRLGTDSSLPPDYQGFRAASELGRSILAAGQPSSCRPTTDRGCKAAIQGAAPHRRIRRRDQGRAVGDESASRNRKFESTPLQRGVCCEPAARASYAGYRFPAEIKVEPLDCDLSIFRVGAGTAVDCLRCSGHGLHREADRCLPVEHRSTERLCNEPDRGRVAGALSR
jgi:hypothetical protein